jgi:hypothetical protein
MSSYGMTVRQWNAIVELIERGYEPGKYTELRRQMDYVREAMHRPLYRFCAEHLVEMEEYEPGMIRCPKWYGTGDE